ncbi:MAG: hypothetical protein ISN28_14105 [Ectothiorhodospiraceae bacterium AqS1]|nr:hypothetical protein [Ectothiorhodospiraceae bacterium AqS1]
MVARILDVTAADVSRRREKRAMWLSGALKSNWRYAKDLEIKNLCFKVGELTVIIELRDKKIERLEACCPFVRFEVKLMSVVVSSFGEKPYGVERVCKAWRMSRSTVYRHLKRVFGNLPLCRRPGPDGRCPMPDAKT